MAAIAYLVLQQAIIRSQGQDSLLRKAIGRDWKGKLSLVLYIVAIVATLRYSWIAQASFVIAALIYLGWEKPFRGRLPSTLTGNV